MIPFSKSRSVRALRNSRDIPGTNSDISELDREKDVLPNQFNIELRDRLPWAPIPQNQFNRDGKIRVVSIVQLPKESFYDTHNRYSFLVRDDLLRLMVEFDGILKGQYLWLWALLGAVFSGYAVIHLIPALTGFNFPTSAELQLRKISCYTFISAVMCFA